MARSWGELLGDEDARPEPENGGGGVFARLRDSLGRSRRALTEQIGAATFDAGDEASWERLEEALIAADVGVPATAELVQRLEARPDAGAGLTAALQEEIARMLGDPGRLELDGRPSVILVVGVNGTGKTTTIGKLAQKLREHDRTVLRRNDFGFLRMWSIHPSQIQPIVDAMKPDLGEVADGAAILLAAQRNDWGPIQYKGELHDRATYRYYWELLQKAKVTGVSVPEEAAAAFF